MNIVFVSDFFSPDSGYLPNILIKYFAKRGHRVILVSSAIERLPGALKVLFGTENVSERDNTFQEKYHVRIIRVPIWGYKSGRSIYKRDIFRIIDGLNPDVLYISGNDTYIGIRYTLKYKHLNFPIVMDSHMLAMAVQNRFASLFHAWYRKFISPIIVKNNIPVIRMQDDPYVEQYLGIPLSRAPFISVGSDTSLFHPDYEARELFRRENNIPTDAKIVLYAGAITAAKGLDLMAEAIKDPFSHNDVYFIIIGDFYGEFGEKVKRVFDESRNKILFFPRQKYEDLAKYYQAADYCVFPKQCSLSFYDVQACGIPVLFEDNELNWTRAAQGTAFTYQCGSPEDFRNRLQELLDWSSEERQTISDKAVQWITENYNDEKVVDQYLEVMKDAVEDWKRRNR